MAPTGLLRVWGRAHTTRGCQEGGSRGAHRNGPMLNAGGAVEKGPAVRRWPARPPPDHWMPRGIATPSLRRADSKKGAWEPDEEALMVNMHCQMGPTWSKISKMLDNRTENDVKK